MLGQLPELPKDSASSLEKALEEARADVKRLRKMRREGRGLGEVSEDADLTFMNPEDRLAAEDAGKFTDGGLSGSAPKGSAARASEAAAADTQIGPDTDKPVMDLTMEELEGINTGGWDGPLCWTKEL